VPNVPVIKDENKVLAQEEDLEKVEANVLCTLVAVTCAQAGPVSSWLRS
jgi:hypothetical protein